MRRTNHRGQIGLMWGILSTLVVFGSACAANGQVNVAGSSSVIPGIEVLLRDSSALLRGKRIGFVTNLAAVDRQGVGAIARLRAAKVNLVALFAPEHGLTVTAAPGEQVANTTDTVSNIPIYSLYGQTKAPTVEMLKGIDVLLIDLPDVGARYFTYLATTIEVMKAAAPLRIPVVVLDRPNPIGGVMQGNILDTAFRSAVGILAMPMRHGLTLGEGARLARADMAIPVELTVVPVTGWSRTATQLTTGLPFNPPSPNLKDIESLFHYPGLCLFEGTPLSVGRGTDFPFHQIGAVWLDTTMVLSLVRAARLDGVRFEGVVFTPSQPGDGKSADTTVKGIRWIMTDAARYDPVRTAVTMLTAIRAIHPTRLVFGASFDRLAGGPSLRDAILRGNDADIIIRGWQTALDEYRRRVRPFLLYR